MTRGQIKKMFIYMGYDIDVVRYYMSFSSIDNYWKIEYVDRDMKLKSYAEFEKTGNDLEDRKRYIEYYKNTKKINEFRAKARMYNAYCASQFERKMTSNISASDLYDAVIENKNKFDELQARFDNNEISFSEFEDELDNIGTIGACVKEYRNGMGISRFNLFDACAYASGDAKLDVSKKKASFVRVVNAIHNWYVNYYLRNEIQMNYYA